MPDTAVDTVIAALLRARRAGRPVETIPHAALLTSAEQAYAVQAGVARELGWFDAGPPMHWKSGGSSRNVSLTHAPLPPAGIWNSPATAGDWPFTLHGIEAEIALRLGTAVDAATAASVDESRAAKFIDAMCVSIEIVDSRWSEGLTAAPLLRLADLQSHGALVLGDWVPYAPRDWNRQPCRVTIDGRVMVECTGTHALGSAVWGLGPWLRHATRHRTVVPAGCVVTTGTWVGVIDAASGNKISVEFDGIGSAEVRL